MRLLVVSEPEAAASALVRVLAGLSPVRRGRLEVAGLSDPTSRGWGRRVAHLGPNPGLHGWMTPGETVRLVAELLDLAPDEAEAGASRALAWAGIGPEDAGRPIGGRGPGILQRTGLAAAIVADPEVLLLDEPLRALDAAERTRLLSLPGRRHTVVLATRHPASEVGLASHVALLRGGRVVLVAPVTALAESGLPLSRQGIAALADRQAGATSSRADRADHRAAEATP